MSPRYGPPSNTPILKILQEANQSESDDDTGDDDDSQEESEGGKGIIPMTGDMETDQEVLQFLEARKQVFQAIKLRKEENENKG